MFELRKEIQDGDYLAGSINPNTIFHCQVVFLSILIYVFEGFIKIEDLFTVE